jgi:hypothetical protein
MGDVNIKVRRETVHQPTIERFSLMHVRVKIKEMKSKRVEERCPQLVDALALSTIF